VAVAGWIIDKSAAARGSDPVAREQLVALAGLLYICPMGELEQLYSSRSAGDYDTERDRIHADYRLIAAPPDIFERALRLQRDLAHHHGMWHRLPIPDLFIAETAMFHDLGVLHVDGDFERIAEVRPLVVRRLGSAQGTY
jgi:predicted nucleic acid-binding protein